MVTNQEIKSGLRLKKDAVELKSTTLENIMDVVEATNIQVVQRLSGDEQLLVENAAGDYVSIRINNKFIPHGTPIVELFAYPVYTGISDAGNQYFTLSRKAEGNKPLQSMTVAEIRAAFTKSGKVVVG